MPHLDICTFIVQYNWTIITFLSLYVIVSVRSIPVISKILHLRTRKIMDGKQTQLDNSLSQELNATRSILKNSLTR